MSGVKKISNVLLGSDIEFFLQDVQSKEVVSAEGYVKGTKHEPHVFDPTSRFWATSLDNVLYEGNIPPAGDKVTWFRNIEKLKNHIKSTLPENLDILAIPSYELDEKWLNTDNARRFGCDPSYCVWTRGVNEAPDNNTNLRSAGMHVHASWEGMDIEAIEEWVKAMDLYLGIPSVLIEPANNRRKLYGKAGEFRFSENYDRAEYRSGSSYFAKDEALINYVYDQTHLAIEFLNNGKTIDLGSPLAEEIVQAINTSDKKLAEKLVKEFNIPVLA